MRIFYENIGHIYIFILNFKNREADFNDLNFYDHLFLKNVFHI